MSRVGEVTPAGGREDVVAPGAMHGSGRRHPRRRRRLRLVAAVVLVALVLAAGAAGLGFGGAEEPAPTRVTLPPATAKVARGTLTQTETVDGTLGYGDPTTVVSRRRAGVLTWLPAPGALVRAGAPIYKVDNRPVVLLYGSLPMYRALRDGVTGPDVNLLEKNLAAFGYDGMTVDEEYTDATADVVREWQEDLDLPETGRVEMDQVVVAPRPVRVAERKLNIGDPPTGPVLTYTGTTRIVTVDLDVAKQQLVRKGIGATVELPNGRPVAGTVTRVGRVAATTTAGSDQEPTTAIDVTVSVRNQKALGTLDAAPVRVTLRAEQRRNVLTVPVNALVALAEGGYGVQVVEGASARYLAVETGLFAGGRVEVTGASLSDGMTVGVPE